MAGRHPVNKPSLAALQQGPRTAPQLSWVVLSETSIQLNAARLPRLPSGLSDEKSKEASR